jgi:hypothetical protein
MRGDEDRGNIPRDCYRRDVGLKVLVCPQCGSADLYYEAGLLTGYKYHCKRCDYIGPLVIEKDLDEMEEERSGEHDA